VMECAVPETDVALVAIGYRHNSKKTLCFVMTKEAGSTLHGSTPHVAKFPDQFGNSMSRRIAALGLKSYQLIFETATALMCTTISGSTC